MDISFLIIVFVILFLALFILKQSYDIINLLTNYFFKNKLGQHFLPKELKREYKEVLATKFAYYQKLNDKDKLLFERRVQKFINMKQFIPRQGLKITPEVIALIAGSAIQITFGYPGIYFKHFSRILIYSDQYYSSITKKYHNGEVNTGGIIVLSWKNFVSGYLDPTDGRNLGLHEMAHALRIENDIRNNEYDFINPDLFKTFDEEARKEIAKIKMGQKTIFREYGITNNQEFFAVAVECFFEKPKDFVKSAPKLYYIMALILKQDLLEKMIA